jgi:hypothetical protein
MNLRFLLLLCDVTSLLQTAWIASFVGYFSLDLNSGYRCTTLTGFVIVRFLIDPNSSVFCSGNLGLLLGTKFSLSSQLLFDEKYSQLSAPLIESDIMLASRAMYRF